MKRVLVVFVLSMSLLSTDAFSQLIDDTLRYTESLLAMKKKALVLDYLQLTEAEKASFWPIYDDYSNAIQYLELEYLFLLREATSLSSDAEKEMVWNAERFLRNDLLLARVRRQYFRKFKRALSSAQASKFMQFDQTFRTFIRMEVQKDPQNMASLQTALYSSVN